MADFKVVGGAVGTVACAFGVVTGGVLQVATLGQAKWAKDMTDDYAQWTGNCAKFTADNANKSAVKMLVANPTEAVIAGARTAVHYQAGVWGVIEDAGAMVFRAPARLLQSEMNGYFYEEVPPIDRHMAFLSRAVYAGHLTVNDQGKRCAEWTTEDDERKTKMVLDKDINFKKVALYLYGADAMVLTFQGTEDSDDIASDLLILLGVLSAAANEKEKEMGKALRSLGMHKYSCLGAFLRAKHPNRKLYVAGHSLGGSAAMTFAGCRPNCDYVDYCWAFNPGTGVWQQNDTDIRNPLDWLRNSEVVRGAENAVAWMNGWQKKIQAHHICGDPVSALTSASAKTSMKSWKNSVMNPHSMDNFLPIKWCQQQDALQKS